jgi:hypothetical protein
MAGRDRITESRFRDRDQARQRDRGRAGGLTHVQVEAGAGIGGHDRQDLNRASGFVVERWCNTSQIRARSQRAPQQRPAGGPGTAGQRGRGNGHDLDVHDSPQASSHVEQCFYRPQPNLFPDVDMHPDRRRPMGEIASGRSPGPGCDARRGQSRVGRHPGAEALQRQTARVVDARRGQCLAEMGVRLDQRREEQVPAKVQDLSGWRMACGGTADGNDRAARDEDVRNPAVSQACTPEPKCTRGGEAERDVRGRRRNDEHASLPFARRPSRPW